MPARPYNIPCHISPGHTIYHAMPARRYHIPCYISLGHTICHAMPGRLYTIPCQTSPGIPYTMQCQQGHNIYRAIPRQAICHARQTIPCHTPPDNNIYHAVPRQAKIHCDAHQAILLTMPCPPDHTIYHAVAARQYYIPYHARLAILYSSSRRATPYTIPYLARQYHIPCHARHDIPNTMPGPPSNTIYHAMLTKP